MRGDLTVRDGRWLLGLNSGRGVVDLRRGLQNERCRLR